MNIKKTFYLLFVLIAVSKGYSQNLVPNYSFEEYTSCPDYYYQTNRLVGWEININSSDYLNACADQMSGVSVPTNFAGGFQYAADGSAYCGFYGYTRTITTHNDAREFIGCQLSSPLIIGLKYYVSLEVNLMNASNCAINKIGVLFITSNIYGDTLIQQPPPLINNFAQIYTDSIISDTTKWSTIRGSFIADSTYNYLLIGNFFDTSNFDSVLFAGSKCLSYFLVDNVCVSTDSLTCNQTSKIAEINSENEVFNVYPNPSVNEITIDIKENFKSSNVIFYDILGKKYREFSILPNVIHVNISNFNAGIYFIQLNINNKLFYKKIIINH